MKITFFLWNVIPCSLADRLLRLWTQLLPLSVSDNESNIWYDMIWYMIWYICWLQWGIHPVAVVQYTFTHKQYTKQHKNLEECGPCPIFGGFTPAFPLQLRKKHGKTSVLELWDLSHRVHGATFHESFFASFAYALPFSDIPFLCSAIQWYSAYIRGSVTFVIIYSTKLSLNRLSSAQFLRR